MQTVLKYTTINMLNVNDKPQSIQAHKNNEAFLYWGAENHQKAFTLKKSSPYVGESIPVPNCLPYQPNLMMLLLTDGLSSAVTFSFGSTMLQK